MKYVFDTEVVLKFYIGERGAEVVKKHFEKVASGQDEGYINLVNLAEFYYMLHRKSPSLADEKVNNLISFGIKTVDIRENWKAAAKLKADKVIPLGDAFAAATAVTLDAVLLVGDDSDFTGLRIKTEKV